MAAFLEKRPAQLRGSLTAVAGDEVDVVVIGSGFGGSTTALRLTEKGYRVAVLEAGRRFDETHAAEDVVAAALVPVGAEARLLRHPAHLAAQGRDGAGRAPASGGGSLNYANTLYEPLAPFYADPQWGHITDWRAELAPFYDQAKRMLGVVPNPTITPSDEVMREVAEEMGVGDTFGPTPVGVFFGQPGVEVRRPVLRRRRAGAARLHRVRRVHDRLPPRRQEHAAAELPLPGRAGGRRGAPDDDGDPDPPAARRSLRRGHRAHRVVGAQAAAHVRGARRGARRRDDGHAAAAAPHARRGPPPAPLRPAGRAHPHELRGHPRRPHVPARRRLHQGRRHHVVVPPRRPDPHRAGALRQGQQRDGAAHHRAGRRRRSLPAAHLAPRGGPPPGDAAAQPEHAALVGADHHRPGDADARQLDHLLHQEGLARAPEAHVEAGPRRAEPHLDPRRPRRRAPHRHQDQGLRRRRLERRVQHPDDRPLPRRRADRRLGATPA